MKQELTVEIATFTIGSRLAMSGFLSRHEPGAVYVIGDDQEYGLIAIEQSGEVSGSDVYRPLGDRKKFIENHRDARFFPICQEALDDLNEFGFMYNEGTGLFEVPRKK